jgi:hypothetical protein
MWTQIIGTIRMQHMPLINHWWRWQIHCRCVADMNRPVVIEEAPRSDERDERPVAVRQGATNL